METCYHSTKTLRVTRLSNDPAKVAYAKFATTVNLQTLKDNKVYEGTVKFFDKEGTFLSQSVVKVQKVLPTVLPEGFSIKTNQLDAQGVYNCYLVPNSWTADKTTPNTNTGTMAMSHVFNYGKAAAADYEITFAGAKKDKNKDVDNTVTGDKSLTVVPNKKNYSIYWLSIENLNRFLYVINGGQFARIITFIER